MGPARTGGASGARLDPKFAVGTRHWGKVGPSSVNREGRGLWIDIGALRDGLLGCELRENYAGGLQHSLVVRQGARDVEIPLCVGDEILAEMDSTFLGHDQQRRYDLRLAEGEICPVRREGMRLKFLSPRDGVAAIPEGLAASEEPMGLIDVGGQGEPSRDARVSLCGGAQSHPLMLPDSMVKPFGCLWSRPARLRIGEVLSDAQQSEFIFSPYRRSIFFPEYPGHVVGTAVVHPVFGFDTGADATFVAWRREKMEDMLAGAARGELHFDLDPAQKIFVARLMLKDIPFGIAILRLTAFGSKFVTVPLGFLPDGIRLEDEIKVYVFVDQNTLLESKTGRACPPEKYAVLKALRQRLLESSEPFDGIVVGRAGGAEEASITVRFVFGANYLFGRVSLSPKKAEDLSIDDPVRVYLADHELGLLKMMAEFSPLCADEILLTLLCGGFPLKLI
ncbi:MAG: hypothetical protein WC901_02025 [Candidatus Margulisiibacteriota bacterium]